MIDRTQLTEALGHAEHWLSLHTDTEKQVMAEAARILLDFPTDEMVEHGAVALSEKYPMFVASYAAPREVTRVVLEAVRRVMFGA